MPLGLTLLDLEAAERCGEKGRRVLVPPRQGSLPAVGQESFIAGEQAANGSTLGSKAASQWIPGVHRSADAG